LNAAERSRPSPDTFGVDLSHFVGEVQIQISLCASPTKWESPTSRRLGG
jgi:hypothetical protein